jgi:anti-sigma-K factor RskA
MTCDELREEYGAYALGIAENPERAEIAEHLARQCPQCTPGVREVLATVAAMSGAVKESEPPKRLRRRVTSMVSPEEKKSSWWAIGAGWVTAGAMAFALMIAIRAPKADSSRLEQALSILNDPTTKDVSFGEPTARGRVFVSPQKGVVFIAAHLPPLDAHKTFELWLLPAKGDPIPAGTFGRQEDASAVYVRPGPVNDAAAVAVTVEPEGGSLKPTTTPFIVTKL